MSLLFLVIVVANRALVNAFKEASSFRFVESAGWLRLLYLASVAEDRDVV